MDVSKYTWRGSGSDPSLELSSKFGVEEERANTRGEAEYECEILQVLCRDCRWLWKAIGGWNWSGKYEV